MSVFNNKEERGNKIRMTKKKLRNADLTTNLIMMATALVLSVISLIHDIFNGNIRFSDFGMPILFATLFVFFIYKKFGKNIQENVSGENEEDSGDDTEEASFFEFSENHAENETGIFDFSEDYTENGAETDED